LQGRRAAHTTERCNNILSQLDLVAQCHILQQSESL